MSAVRMHLRRSALLLVLVAAGCANAPKTELYAFRPTTLPQAGESRLQVAVGPVSLPELVNRPQIVVLTGDHTVHVSDLNRWAEPLTTAFPRQLATELAKQLDSTRVRLYGQDPADDAAIRVSVDVLRFEGALGNFTAIEAVWSLQRKGAPPHSGRSYVREPLPADGYAALVAGFERATARVAADLAAAIRAPQ